MNYKDGKAENVKIAYIGGGSQGWAWGLMSDLALAEDMSGDVCLYDINYDAALHNEIIGNKYKELEDTKAMWNYKAVESIGDALTGADFVVISILPGTFDEMEKDVHLPEKYGIYQSVGDTMGPGGIIRAMRTIPMYEEIAENIKKYCPDAWVISYTNPMTLCVKTLYRVFPQIKAFGCCHEVFGTQRFLADVLDKSLGIKDVKREEIKVSPIGVNHFTWFTSARYKNMDLFPVYKKYVKEYNEKYAQEKDPENIDCFTSTNEVKMDLFSEYGYIAAAGDRHLAEFCDGERYLKNPETVAKWGFALTPVSWRKEELKERLEKSEALRNGTKALEISQTGEEGVKQMRALLGLGDLITNVNIPNRGQISNLPMGAVVETNAVFRNNSVKPVLEGDVPQSIYKLISHACNEQEGLSEAIANRDIEGIFEVFVTDKLVTCSKEDARKLFNEMVMGTKKYLTMYDLSNLEKGVLNR